MSSTDPTTSTSYDIPHFLSQIRASDGTKRKYLYALQSFQRWTNHPLPPSSDIEVNTYLQYMESEGKSPSTIGVHCAALKRVMKYHRIPTDRLERFTVVLQPPRYLSREEIKKLIESADGLGLKCLVALLFSTGARVSELLSAKTADIDWGTEEEGGTMKVVRKGGRDDVLNVGGWGMDYLRQWTLSRNSNSREIFLGWTYHQVRRWLLEAAERAGIAGFRIHSIRHSTAMSLREMGVDWADIGYQLGHVRPSKTIDVYARPKVEELKRTIPRLEP